MPLIYPLTIYNDATPAHHIERTARLAVENRILKDRISGYIHRVAELERHNAELQVSLDGCTQSMKQLEDAITDLS